MTTSVPPFLDGLVPDEPFDLDWTDVHARSRQITVQKTQSVAHPRRRPATVRWRIGIAIVIAVAAIGVPLTAFAVGLVSDAPPIHPTMHQGPIAVALPLTSPRWTAASTAARLRIAGTRRQVSIVIAGDFTLPHPLNPELTPIPPKGRLAISVRHFPAKGVSRHWPAVKTIRLSPIEQQRLVVLHTRLGTEAVVIEVRFGSAPSQEQVALANTFLAGIQSTGE
jgi:hypothetical protein